MQLICKSGHCESITLERVSFINKFEQKSNVKKNKIKKIQIYFEIYTYLVLLKQDVRTRNWSGQVMYESSVLGLELELNVRKKGEGMPHYPQAQT